MAKKDIRIICKNIFKSGSETSVRIFTQKWIEVINLLEKRRFASVNKR